MPVCDRHRLGRVDRLGVGQPLRRGRVRGGRPGERHARALLRRGRVDRAHDRGAARALPARVRTLELDIRDADGVQRVFAEHAGEIELVIHTAAQPSHDWAASDPQTDFGVNANGTLNLLEATRDTRPDRDVHVLLDEQGLRRSAQLAAADGAGAAGWSFPRITATHDGHRHDDVDRPDRTHSLFGVSKAAADLLVQEYGRYFDMPTVCFRGGCLTGPNHAGTQLHGFLSYLMRCTMTGEPYTVFGYGGKQVRDNIHAADLVARVRGFPPRSARGRGLQHRRRPPDQLLDARGDRAVRGDRRPRARLESRRGQPDRRPPLVDQRPGAVQAGLPGLGHHAGRARHPAPDPRPQRRAVGRARVKLSVVIPAHNEVESIGATVEAVVAELRAERIPYEIVVVDDNSGDGTGEVVRAIGERDPAVRCIRSPRSPGFGQAVRSGLEEYTGDAVAIVMADLSDSPQDLVRYYRVLEEGFDCAFGSRFVRGGQVGDYPKVKLVLNRLVNLGIRVLFRHGYNDTTNAFKAYRREVIDNVAAAALTPLQPHGRDAAEGGRAGSLLCDRADLMDEPGARRVQAQAPGDGQPLPVHRALRVPGAPPQPRGLPAVS